MDTPSLVNNAVFWSTFAVMGTGGGPPSQPWSGQQEATTRRRRRRSLASRSRSKFSCCGHTHPIQVNIAIMRAFTDLRRMLASHRDLAGKVKDLESKCDSQFKVVFEAIRQLLAPTFSAKKKPIGFRKGQ